MTTNSSDVFSINYCIYSNERLDPLFKFLNLPSTPCCLFKCSTDFRKLFLLECSKKNSATIIKSPSIPLGKKRRKQPDFD